MPETYQIHYRNQSVKISTNISGHILKYPRRDNVSSFPLSTNKSSIQYWVVGIIGDMRYDIWYYLTDGTVMFVMYTMC